MIVDKTKEFEEFFKDTKDRPEIISLLGAVHKRKIFSLVSKNAQCFEAMESLQKIMNGSFFERDYRSHGEKETIDEIFGENEKVIKIQNHFWLNRGVYVLDNPVNQIKELSTKLGMEEGVVRDILSDTKKNYSRFFIWKDEEHTKKRWIEAPNDVLKNIQEQILHNVIYKMAATKFAHGFIHGRSIVSCAKEHTGKKFVLKLDLKNFFPSISREMVYGAMYNELTPENVKIIIPAIELCLMDGRLPQGAPTSPAISNIVCKPLDMVLYGIAEKFCLTYTRYADDLIFSGDDDTIYKVIPIIKSTIAKFGLVVNEKKVKVLKRHQRQTVTGLVVNADGQTSVRRRKRMNLRAYMHQILIGKKPIDRVNLNRLRGNVNLINMANPNQGKWFVEKLNEIVAMTK